MNHTDHVNLLRDGIPEPGGTWADFGSGAGAFTLALAELLGPDGTIHAVDKNRRALSELRRVTAARFPQLTLHILAADFTYPFDLPPLDGVVMANSLHFVREKDRVFELVRGCLKPGGRLIVVEYNTDQSNKWVPYPFSYRTWEALAYRSGFVETQLLATRPSHFLGEIYSAISLLPDVD